jgi:hypothetical protein
MNTRRRRHARDCRARTAKGLGGRWPRFGPWRRRSRKKRASTTGTVTPSKLFTTSSSQRLLDTMLAHSTDTELLAISRILEVPVSEKRLRQKAKATAKATATATATAKATATTTTTATATAAATAYRQKVMSGCRQQARGMKRIWRRALRFPASFVKNLVLKTLKTAKNIVKLALTEWTAVFTRGWIYLVIVEPIKLVLVFLRGMLRYAYNISIHPFKKQVTLTRQDRAKVRELHGVFSDIMLRMADLRQFADKAPKTTTARPAVK